MSRLGGNRKMGTTRRRSARPWLAVLCATAVMGIGAAPAFAAGGSSSSASSTVATGHNGGLVALGDSITFGYNLNPANLTPSPQAFPALVGQADHLPVSNLGVPSWTTTDLLSVMGAPNVDRAVQNARVVSIDIGNNDLLHLASQLGLLKADQAHPKTPITITTAQKAQFAAAIGELAKNLGGIIAAVQAQTHAPVVVYNLYDPFPAGIGLHAAAEQFVPAANQAIAQVAAKFNVPVLDAYTAFNGKQTTLVRVAEGDVHPTPAGQKVLAGLLETEIGKLSLPKGAVAGASNAVTTSLATNPVDPAGSTWSAGLGAGTVTVTAPAGAILFHDNAAVTSVNPSAVVGLVPATESVIAEFGVDFASGDTPQKAVSVKYVDASIPAGAKLEEVVGGKLVPMNGASVKKGTVQAAVIGDADFVVVAPKAKTSAKPPVVPGATSPQTGFPWATDAVAGILLITFGGFAVAKSRGRRK